MNIISVVPLVIATMLILYSIGALYQPTVQASVPALLSEEVLTQGNGITPIIIVSIICFFASAILELLFIYHHLTKYLGGYEIFIILGVVIISVLVSIYAKKILN